MRLLVGLGNPGPRYCDTRHNFGFEVVDRLARLSSSSWQRRYRSSLVAGAELAGQPVLLAKPQTYMNLSGRAVGEIMEDEGLSPSEMLIVLDDVALPLGSLRIRPRGGDGGHLGLASVLEVVGDEGVPRMRLGIRPGLDPRDLSDFVLAPFTSDERPVVEQVVHRAIDAMRSIIAEGIDKAMSVYNATASE